MTRRRTPLDFPAAEAHTCTHDVRRRMLARVPLFAALTPAELAEVDRRCRAQAYDTGEAVHHAGTPATGFFVVATGAVKVTRPALDGRETLLELCGPGDFLGAVPALGEETYSDSGWAIAPSCLLTLGTDDFSTIMADHPSVALAALHGVSRRLSNAQRAVHLLSGAPLEQRLAATLLALAEKVGRPWEGITLLHVPLTREDLAGMTGAASESVSRVLSAWRRSGHLESGRGWVAVRDADALERIRDAEPA